jgi:hypothetical protein
MITKDDKIMCDSCSKEIVGEPYVVNDKREGWAITKLNGQEYLRASHFHPTAQECSMAIERVTITIKRRHTQRDREQTWQNT